MPKIVRFGQINYCDYYCVAAVTFFNGQKCKVHSFVRLLHSAYYCVVLAAETRADCNECRFLDLNRRGIAIPLSPWNCVGAIVSPKTALEARFGALEGDMPKHDHTYSNRVGGRVQRLGSSAPRHLSCMSGTSKSNGLITHTLPVVWCRLSCSCRRLRRTRVVVAPDAKVRR